MERRCYICGDTGADILCSECGRFVCDKCYDDYSEACIKCTNRSSSGIIYPKKLLFISGVILILLGLTVTAMGITPGFFDGEVIVLFPFFIGTASGWWAAAASILFFIAFMIMSLIPLMISGRHGRFNRVDEAWYSIQNGRMSGVGFEEKIEYMITTKMPSTLLESIYFESYNGKIVIKSEFDESFEKKNMCSLKDSMWME